MDYSDYSKLSPEEKRRQLYLDQKATLDSFVERGAISKDQYEQSLKTLQDKMGMT